MNEFTQHRLERSVACLQDGDTEELSGHSRLRLYFQAGYNSLLAALELVDAEVIHRSKGWDFPAVLQAAGKHLELSAADITRGIELSVASHAMPPGDPLPAELAVAREWAIRVRGSVDIWMQASLK